MAISDMVGVKPTPYWWEAAEPRDLAEQPVPKAVDVVIVGAGYAGISAAITLARAGRDVQVFDAMRPGEGASSRNGGITSGNIRPSHADLTRKFGKERADAITLEGKLAREDLYRFISEEGIDCDFALTGRFVGATTRKEYDALARSAEDLKKDLGIEAFAVPESEQNKYIGTGYYRGGNVRMDVGGVHPAKLHAEMLRKALESGATVHGCTAVTGIRDDGDGFEVETARGRIKAKQILECTNGYTDAADKWLRRRLVPVRSRIIATEALPEDVMKRLVPGKMMLSDTRQLSYYYRPSPDGTQILFGGRDGTTAGDPLWPTTHLQAQLSEIFPELKGVGLTHSWHGNVAMHRDMIPRVFTKKGRRFATGFCGSGVVWARWAGQKAALQMLGDSAGGATPFDFRPMAAVPLFRGKTWFMPLVYAGFKYKDGKKMRERKREG